MSEPRAIEHEEGSGNVFEDLGFDKGTAARLVHKAELVGLLHRLQQERRLTQSAFARLVGIPQPRLSRLYGGRIDGLSTDKLLEAVARLGGRVTIRVEPHPAPGYAGRVELEMA